MAFTVTTRLSATTVNNTTHTVTLPDGSNVSGRRVVIVVGVDDEPTVTWPTGWTGFFSATANGVRLAAAYRDIDGTEGFDGTDDSIAFTTSASEQSNHHSYLIDGHDAATAPEAATAATGDGANADPPSLDPAGWDTEETLWIAAAAYRFTTTFTAAPTDYTNLLALAGGDTNAPLGSARRILSAASENPGAFTVGNGAQWVATTIAVRPGAAAAPEVTASIPLILDIAAQSATDHAATASIPLELDIAPAVSVTHQAQTSIPLTLDIAATSVTDHQAQTSIPLTIDLAAATATDHAVTAAIPLNLNVVPVTDAPGINTVTASIPLILDIAPQTAIGHAVTTAIPLQLAMAPVTRDPARKGRPIQPFAPARPIQPSTP